MRDKAIFLTRILPPLISRRGPGTFLSSSPDPANRLILSGSMETETITLSGLLRKKPCQQTIHLSPPALLFSLDGRPFASGDWCPI